MPMYAEMFKTNNQNPTRILRALPSLSGIAIQQHCSQFVPIQQAEDKEHLQ